MIDMASKLRPARPPSQDPQGWSHTPLRPRYRAPRIEREVERMAVTEQTGLDELCVNTIRTLSMDAVQKANSGHPGTPMALAPLAYVLYTRVMRHAPQHPRWPARDRFVLSCGHAS